MIKLRPSILRTLVTAGVALVLFITTRAQTVSSQTASGQHQQPVTELSQGQFHSDIPPGFMLIEGDIVVPVEFFTKGTNIGPNSPEGTWRTSFWPNATVPYEFDANVSAARQTTALNAMAAWQNASNIQFVQCASNSCTGAFIHIQNSTGNNSEVGFQNRRQDVNIVDWDVPTILHELGHALGYWHEQSRADRVDYITINYTNIQSGQAHNFDERPAPGGEYGPYDFASIMHYNQCAFSVDCPLGSSCTCTRSTITVKPPNTSWQTQIGRASNLSLWDQRVMSFLYPRSDWRFVDINHQGSETGGFFTPYKQFVAGINNTPDGGGVSSGGAYALNAMLSSQGTSTSSGGGYTLGGVWAGSPEKLPRARLPIVVR